MRPLNLDLAAAIRNLPSNERARLRQILMAKGADLSAIPIIERPSDLSVIPASFAQQRLWFLHQLDPHSTAYNVPSVVRMDGALKIDALRQAFNQVVRRHDSLRTTFSFLDGLPVQVIAPSTDFGLLQTDLSMLDASERARQSELLIQQAAESTFDLATGPLLRAHLLRVAPTEHILLLTAHHIVVDGASMEVLAGELMALYEAYVTGRAPTLPDLPFQYADYAYWQRHWLGDEALQASIDYWTQQLKGAPEVLALPTDRPRLPARTRPGATVVLKLGRPLTQQLHALALQTQTTLFMVLCAAFNVLLWRYSGQDDICVGTAMSGRPRAELEPLIGLFANTLVMRTRLRATDSFSELLQQVKATTLDAHAHQDAPFEQLLHVLQPTRDARYSPLFQVMLVLQDAANPMWQAAGLELTWPRHGSTQAKFDLTLNIFEDGGHITARFEYDASLFDASTIERMARHFEHLLQDATARPHTTLDRLQMLGEPERRQVLHVFNDTAASFPEDLCIHRLFEQQAVRTPEATALVFEGASLTYHELNTQANRLAHHLIDLGMRPDSRVAIALPRGIDLVVALLATLKAGGAYVPLDPDYPAERLAFMLADSSPCVLITDTATCTALGGMPDALTVLQLDADRSWQSLPSTNPNLDALGLTSSHLAYVIYTSGSTGQPKGAMNEHRGVVNRLLWMQQTYGLDASDSVLQKTSFGFDVSVWEFFWPLLAGARLVLARPQGQRDAAYLADLIEREHITTLHFVPSMLSAFLAAMTQGSCSRLQRVICSGEALEPHQVSFVHERLAHTRLYNLYGPTEAAIDVTAGEPQPDQTVTIGSPIANTRIYILDALGQPSPVHVAGEICIAGVQVARGYLRRPDLTAEHFVPDPFSEPGSRMYRTGDLGRWRPDGTIEFLGRTDHQVKIRGLRIELGEIEAALRAHAEVSVAVVLAREDVPGDKRLVAYVVGEAAPEVLRQHLGSRLPEYMVPAAYVVLDALPLTPNGKLDRRALPAPEADAFGTRAYEAPQGQIETLIAHLWSELLGIERIGRHDDFFALGGHSLLAVQLISRIRATLGLDVPLAELFAQPTLTGCAQRVAAGTASALPAIVPASRPQALPLSFAQQRLWFLAQLDERAGAAYAIPGGVRLKGSLDVAALHAAMNRLVARHEALRTCFGMVNGAPTQLIAPPVTGLALSQVNLSGHSHPEAELERLAAEEASTPFDLARGPLVRARLIRLADHDHALLVTMHHIVSDGWSMGVLVHEFSALYAAFSQGQPEPLPPLPIQYADYALWQRRWITGEVLQRQLDFWRDHLRGAPALLQLSTDRPRPAVQDYAGASFSLDFDDQLTADLRALSRRHGTTLFMTLLASWAALLARLSGQSEVVIGTPVANRHRAEIEPLIGFFVNTQALRIDLSGSPTVAQLLSQVRATALAAQGHQDLPFEQVVEALSPQRSLAHSPVFQVMFAWQNTREDRLELPGLQLQTLGVDAPTIKFDLELSIDDTGDGIAGHIGYACALFDRATVERHIGHWQTLLRALVADDQAIVSRLPLMSDDEQHQLLRGFNDTAASFPAERCIHELFEAQVVRTPDATALVFEDISLSYSELNAQANRLAHHLIALGVQPDTRVAIALSRGIDMVVALLATLKAGGAYVPLDPDYPAERLAFMLDDCAARVVLTQSVVHHRLAASRTLTTALVLQLDTEARFWQSRPETNPATRALGLTSAHLAYVIYTSGSTGTPKGVQVAHTSLVNYVLAAADTYALTGADCVLQASSISFDIAVDEIFTTLAAGATLVLPPWPRLPSIVEFIGLIERRELTVLNLPTAYWHEWVTALDEDSSPLPQSVRLVVVGGEAASASRLQRWRTFAGERVVWINSYGPTETTAGVTFGRVEADEPLHIGSPIANTHLYVLDAWGQPVTIGAPGEIYIGGAQVARGYLNQPELTAERFICDPYASEPGARMYRTGDFGRWRADGTIECLGRNDDQVKIRGFRIELGEIEAKLLDHPGVREAVVLARDRARGDKQLVAYITGEGALTPQALRGHLAEQLPEYMVPAAYVQLDALPLTPNGKLDRHALPSPKVDAFRARAYDAPQGEIESTLARLWSELLGIERIGRDDDFFAVGGHSLLAVQLTSRVRVAFGLEVPLGELFARPTLAGYAQRVAAATASSLPTIVPTSRQEALPLSFAQQRLWFLAHLDERAGAAYAMPGGVRLKGLLDVAALQAALNRIVERHEALRTCFGSVGGAPVQLIAPPEVGLSLSHANLSGHEDAEAELERLAVEEASAPFDLARGPLIRGRLIRLDDDDHALLVTMHHIVSDGWSMGVLVSEFSALYAAFSQGQPDPLPALPIQYADFAAWQRRWISGEVLQRQLDFWRDHLSRAPALLELPTDRPRPAVQDYAGASVGFELDAELTANLKALSQRHGTTLFMTLLASWAALLSRLSGQSDVVIGTPVANRHRAEIEPLIGFFVNTQALRVDLSGSPSVAELLAQVRATALAAQAHQDIPFEQVVEALSPVRSMAHSPIFQVMFAWQNAPEGSLDLPGLQLEPVGASSTGIKFDLELTLHDAGELIAGSLGYACALFDRSTIERHVAYWQTLLCGLVADDAAHIGRLPLITSPEQARVLHTFNDTAAAFPQERCIHQLFEEQVARTPDAMGLVFEHTSLTYRELNTRANRLAHHLIALGVCPDSLVAIALPRGIDRVVALLATLKAGGAYVPLDPDYPSERLAYMLDDSSPRVLITDATTNPLRSEPPASLAVLQLDADRAWQSLPDGNPDCMALGLTPRHLAYVIYTSGSTGQPKGVMVAHAGLCNLALVQAHGFSVTPHSRVLQFSSFSFDACIFEVLMALCSGATLHVPPHGMLAGPALRDLLRDRRITHTLLPPAVLNGLPDDALTELQTLVTGGDAVSHALVQRWSAGRRLINAYGPTEATVCASLHRCDPQYPGPPPIGSPIANTRIYILDAHGQPSPVGVAGEIHIAGIQVARGYLRRPELTAERFLPDPFGEPGSRMYKTGDLGRWREDGFIQFVGRNDHQVKVRGFRIELGEIEAALRSHPEVRDTVVLAREDAPGDRQLVAYVVGEAAEPETLRAHLNSRLPQYMVPAAYVVLDALPLTPNGKLDRRALPAPETKAFGARAYEAPQGEIENLLARLWGELLAIERIGRHDDFFALGGHSLLAVQLTSRIRAALGLEVPLAALFAQPTLGGFAQRVAAATASELPAIVPLSRQEALPLSFAQQRLWFLAQLDERAGDAYVVPGGVRLKGSLDVAALHAAMNRIIERHEALRTCFASVDDAPVQLIAPPEVGLALSRLDLSGHTDLEAELERVAAEEAIAPFDLARGPLIRARLIHLADDDHVLLVTMHHIVSDGWSLGVLINEFSALYAAYAHGRPDPLPALPIQYADYAAWQRRWISGEVLQRQLDFWRDHLSGAPALLELPTDRPRPRVQDYSGARLDFELDTELTAGLRALSQRHGITLFMTLLASWAALLARLSGQSDLVIGTPVANRHHAEIEPLIGCFVNTQGLRVDLSGSPTVAELLAQVRSTALAAQAHQDIPFEQIVEALNPTRSMAHTPVFQVMFAWQNVPEGSLDLPGLQLEPVDTSSTTVKFDVVLTVQDAGESIVGSLGYACALFDHTSIERHFSHWQTLLRALVADDGARVACLPLLTPPEQQHLLDAFNDTSAAFPDERCIHQLFEEQVDRTPDATALVFEDTSLTYRELNALANCMAHHLIAVGVHPGSLVAIALPRGIDMVVALLATLKAGGAYVPLDPDYPRERLGYMLTDSAPLALITHTGVRAMLGELPASTAVLTLDAEPRPWLALPATNPEPGAVGLSPAHLAYVIYTSGSTGQPKGVMVAHRNVVHLWAALERGIYAHHPGIQRVSLNASLAFDASVKQWVQLASGRTLVIVPNAARRDAAALVNLIGGIDAFDCTPSQLQLVRSARASAAWRAPTIALVGGESIDPALWEALAGSTKTSYYNVYGPTECTVDSTIALIQPPSVAPHIGRPIANARIYILDTFAAPVAVGMPGDLYISGRGVARGYLGRPDLTAERFVPDPFGEPGSRMYKTGDLGRWRPDGTIQFLGRNDHQVKIRGFRIELGEIEAALRSHPEVRDAVVLARDDTPGDKRLVAYVIGEAAPEALRAHLGARLPEYMVPAAYVALDTLPLTPNGKLDRRALPAPEGDAFGVLAYEAPQGEIEILLAHLWSELLGIERIGRHDDFFALGGHSLLAVQLTSRVRAALGLEVPLAELFAQPTLAGFAQRVASATASTLPAIVPASRQEAPPLSFAQQRLWFLAQLDERAGAVYAIPGGVRLKGSLDVAALQAALNRIVERHESLRTCFGSVDGAPVQVIAPPRGGSGAVARKPLGARRSRGGAGAPGRRRSQHTLRPRPRPADSRPLDPPGR
jgi:amino acid adenylation domain-containing protein